MNIPTDVEFVLNKIRENGFSSYIVGGAVRDYLLGNKPTDFDISTNATPLEIKEIFKNYKTIDNGIKHGTMMVIIKKKMYEITTFRSESSYEKHRKPASVTFIDDLYVDLSRRDFTINAICYYDKIYDYFNGQEDIKQKIIRTVNNPLIRFEEDSLRILRALRFSSTLNFSIEKKTKNAILIKKDNLRYISKERINSELTKILSGNVMLLKDFYDVFLVFIPNLSKNSFLKAIKLINNKYPVEVNLALLLMDYDSVNSILNDLKYPKTVIRSVYAITLESKKIIEDNLYHIRLLFNKYNYDTVINVLNFHHIVNKKEYSFKNINNAYKSCWSLDKLDIDGNDLIRLNIPKKSRGILLNNILSLVMQDKLENKKEILIKYIKEKSTEN